MRRTIAVPGFVNLAGADAASRTATIPAMSGSAVWKVAAVVFACSTAALLWREASRDDAGQAASAPPPDRTAPSATRAARRAEAPVKETPAAEAEAAVAPASPKPPAPAAPQPPSTESVESVVLSMASSSSPNWSDAIRRIGERRDEAARFLERIVRASREVARSGVRLDGLFWTYAWAAGAAAVPLLEERGATDPNAVEPAVAALCIVRDPSAVAAVRRLQARLTGTDSSVSPMTLALSRNPEFQALVREWAENPPANQPWMRNQARDAIWLNGGPEEKEWVWSTATTDDRERLLGWINPTSPAPWPDRLRASVRDDLTSDDAKRRAIAAYRVAGAASLFDDEAYAAAKKVVEADSASASGEAGHLLRQAQARFVDEDARRAREAQLRAILDGR